MSKSKSKNDHSFTKVVWKLCVKPINCPASKQLTKQYQVSWEFKCPNNELYKLEQQTKNATNTFAPDKEETLTNLTINTNFMIKSKTIHCNYDELKNKLGYEPDAMEFDLYLKIVLKQFQTQILKVINVPIAMAS